MTSTAALASTSAINQVAYSASTSTTSTSTNNYNNNGGSPVRVSGSRFFPDYLQFTRIGQQQQQLDNTHSLNELNIPTQMNPKDRHSTIELSKQYMRVIYQGSGKSDSDAASVRSKFPIPPQLGIFYFEVSIISKGRDGYIGIGFSGPNVSLQRLPGWEPNSWGYHGDDGNCFNCSGTGKRFGPTFSTNDTIGCGIDFCNRRAFYTKNGVFLGYAFENIPLDSVSIFPCVGLRTPGEIVELNFGKRKFAFDILTHVQEASESFHLNIQQSVAVNSESVNHLILKHLLYRGYLASAQAFAQSVDYKISQIDVQRCQLKLQLKQLLLNNQYDELISLISEQFANVSDLVLFYLKCQKFVDLVYISLIASSPTSSSSTTTATMTTRLSATATSNSNKNSNNDDFEVLKVALDFGQQLQDDYRVVFRMDDRQEVEQNLMTIFSILAYENPLEHVKVKHLFDTQQKEKLFEYVNNELFGEDDQLHRVYKQLETTVQELEQSGDGSSAFFVLNNFDSPYY